ncbi:MAG: YifB family Mg chelatase-like AAA ATPase [Halothiobacillaceae bacterium]|jgi:magnesium chelatase family protein|nr:YifB family Mg chelatase-like AAA ATPase [Halothiobacillaceae bacterium]MDY0050481.1 YifB family Mg chelatase-like AAA ATPase [Halothiobacillaceae bacterium]
MSLAILHSRALAGLDAPAVSIEVHVANGLPAFTLVGLAETAVKESRDRVRAALINSQFEFPPRRLTVNLAPADLPKDGSRFDLAIAVGLLAATGQLRRPALDSYEFLGELSLSGALRPVPGALPAALKARDTGRTLILPRENAREAARVRDVHLLPATHLTEVSAHLTGVAPLSPWTEAPPPLAPRDTPDLADVRGQHRARRALEIAAAGAHNLLMIGPPGSGKSMLASRLPGILPPMTETEALEAAALASISTQGFCEDDWGQRPFRAPHHSASPAALIGGGSIPRPGEVSLAHQGVLFLDELPEFDRRVLEVLREPLETGQITISRAARQADFPARFMLVAAMNPSPSGLDEDSPAARRYRERLSAPLLDRIDLHVDVPRVPAEALRADETATGEPSAAVAARVAQARKRMLDRAGRANAALDVAQIRAHCLLSPGDARLLETAMEKLALSARARDRILKVARTIADLAGSETIATAHLSEAITYRSLDRLNPRPV